MPRQAAEAAHLALDAAGGEPPSRWLSGFAGNGPPGWMPHVVVGTMGVLAAGESNAR